MRSLMLPLAAAFVLSSPARAGLPIPPELQPLCDHLSTAGACMAETCVCTAENGASSEQDKLLEVAQVMRVAHPEGHLAAYHLIIKTNGQWKDYGAIFNKFSEMPDGSEGTGEIKRFWMSYSVENFGTVLTCDYETEGLFKNIAENAQVKRKTGGMIFAFVHQGELRVLEVQRYLDEDVSRIDKTGPKLDKDVFGKEGRSHWKREVEVLDKGRVRITKATGNHPRLKKPHQLVGMPVLDIMHAFDDEVVVRRPTGE